MVPDHHFMATNPERCTDACWKPVGSIWIDYFRKTLQVVDSVVVEAGGVEPPSEKARNEENYVRIRLMIFDRHL